MTRTVTIRVVDDDAGDVVCVLQVNHPPGVFAPLRVWVGAVTSTHAGVGVSVDGQFGWDFTTPSRGIYTLTCRFIVCNISYNNKETNCMSASEKAHMFLLLYTQC